MNQLPTCWKQLILGAVILTCSACQQEDMQEIGSSDTKELASPVVSNAESSANVENLTIDQQIQNAVAELAFQRGVSADRITIKEAAMVQWPSGAMGCPQPDMNYTQALVPGVRVVLDLFGEDNFYHGRIGKDLFFCPKERAQTPAQGSAIM